ncbi:MAG: leucine-rich repeat domain-containing protein [Culicoidibacterales bacterium]
MNVVKAILGSLILVGTISPVPVSAVSKSDIATTVMGHASVEELFPDKYLAKVVAQELKIGVTDVPTEQQLQGINSLTLGYSAGAIKSLMGLRYLPNIELLEVSYQRVTDFKELAGLSKLKSVVIKTEDVKVAYLSSLNRANHLKILHLHAPNAVELPNLSGFEGLEYLYLQMPSLVDYEEISKLTSLLSFNVRGNVTSDQKDVKINNFDFLKGLTKLERVAMVYQDYIKLEDFVDLKQIKRLTVFGSKLTDISAVASMHNLIELNLYGNEINNIAPLEKMVNLEHLILDGNRISDISPLSNLSRKTNISAVFQEINLTAGYSPDYELVNTIKGLDGNTIVPSLISHLGTYFEGKILFKELVKTDKIAFTFLAGSAIDVPLPRKGEARILSDNSSKSKAVKFAFSGAVVNNFSKPVEEVTSPVEETTKPVEETTKPVEETTKPVEETTKPVEEEMALDNIFNDEEIAKQIGDILGLGPTDVVTEEQLLTIKTIALGSDVKDIRALPRLKNLDKLSLNQTVNIKDYRVLAQNTNLTSLSIVGAEGNIKSIDFLSSLKKLTEVIIVRSEITNIEVLAGLEHLENISLDGNQVDDVTAIKKLTKMKRMTVTHNKILDVSPLANVDSVDASNQVIVYSASLPGENIVYGINQVRGLDGKLITPALISHGGWYEDGKVYFEGLIKGTKPAFTFNLLGTPVVPLPEKATADHVSTSSSLSVNSSIKFSGTVVYVFDQDNHELGARIIVGPGGKLAETGQNTNELIIIGLSTIITGSALLALRRKFYL